MKKLLLASLSGYLATAGLALAQPAPMLSPARPASVVMMPMQPGPMLVQAEPAKEAPHAAPVAAPTAPTTAPTIMNSDCCQDACGCPPRFWANAEYLLWWVKRDDPGIPLITTGDPATAVLIAGALGEPGTAVLASSSSFDNGVHQGLRLEAGYMLNDRIGIAVGGFFLEKKTNFISLQSDAAGAPVLAVPFFDLNTIGPAPFAHQITGADGIVTGSVALAYSTQLWGLEANAVLAGGADRSRNVKLLAGFRYVDLIENYTYHDETTLTPAGAVGNSLFFLGGAAAAGNSVGALDNFRTRNQFYGGQVGVQGEWERGRFVFGATGKLALGVSHESLDVQGVSFQTVTTTGVITASAPGGILALPSNSISQTSNHFAVIPEINVKVGYKITDAVTATVGYNFMYWSSVVRPLDNVPQVSNTFFIPTDGSFGIGGGAGPAPSFIRSNFWAQGVNFGLEFKY